MVYDETSECLFLLDLDPRLTDVILFHNNQYTAAAEACCLHDDWNLHFTRILMNMLEAGFYYGEISSPTPAQESSDSSSCPVH